MFLQHGEDAQTTGAKFVISCQSLITKDDPSTKGWLDSVDALKAINRVKSVTMPHKLILEGILGRRKKVVIKVADAEEDLSNEWNIYKMLHESTKQGISRRNLVQSLCFFTCNDSLKRIVSTLGHDNHGGICQGPGSAVQVLVMEYIDGRSMKNTDWVGLPDGLEVAKSCMTQVVRTTVDAFRSTGFVHGDLHADNVILSKTTVSSIDCYSGGQPVKTHGFIAKLADFELGSFEASATDAQKKQRTNKFLLNLVEFFKKCSDAFYFAFTQAPLQAAGQKIVRWREDDHVTDVTDEMIAELLGYVDDLRTIPPPSSGGGSDVNNAALKKSTKQRRPFFGKKS